VKKSVTQDKLWRIDLEVTPSKATSIAAIHERDGDSLVRNVESLL